MALAELWGAASLADPAVVRFLREYYLRLPVARAGGAEAWAACGHWDSIVQILAQPDVDALLGREGQAAGGNEPLTPETVRARMEAGYTLGVRHAERHDARLATLAAEFQQELGGAINIHLYCTPAEHAGFGWHYDAEEVFVLQCAGSKEWLLRKNTVNPWPLVETLPVDMRFEREIMPVMRCRLEAGHWLYIPAGYWHATRAQAESVSLSVGVEAPTALDVLDHLRPRLLDSLLWRQRLPVTGGAQPDEPEQVQERFQELCRSLGQELAQRLSDRGTVRKLWDAIARGDAPSAPGK